MKIWVVLTWRSLSVKGMKQIECLIKVCLELKMLGSGYVFGAKHDF
jgi:hypothetical protein